MVSPCSIQSPLAPAGPAHRALEAVGALGVLLAVGPDVIPDVVRAVREEWACTLEDVLARRTRLLFLDARAAVRAGPQVASIITAELGHGSNWESEQVKEFIELAKGYLPEGAMTP